MHPEPSTFPPVTQELLHEVVRRILQAGSPKRIVLFGSHARGGTRRDSDLDLLIIEDSDLPRYRRAPRYLRALLGIFPAKDVVVWTPAEVEAWRDVPNAFVTTALREGRTLYDGRITYNVLVPERSRDWMRQAESDLKLARHARDGGHHDWAAFAAHQAAEKAIKAVFQKRHRDAWGHVLSMLLASLGDELHVDASLIDRAKALDKHYIPTRYPNGFERGAPVDFYTREEADRAIADAETIIGFCRDQVG